MKKLLLLAILAVSLPPSIASSKSVRYGEILCEEAGYTCVEIQEGDTWKTLWPDEKIREIVRKFNRMNVRLRKGMKIAIPPKLETLSLLQLAPFPKNIDPPGVKQIHVDLNQLAWGAYDTEGNLVNWGPASGGKAWCPDVGYACRTPSGQFNLFQKGGAGCKSGKFPIPKGGAPMPYCLFFKPGYALHGSYEVPGFNASHGCARLYPEDAKWLNQEFSELPKKTNAHQGTQVIVLPYKDPVLKKAETQPKAP